MQQSWNNFFCCDVKTNPTISKVWAYYAIEQWLQNWGKKKKTKKNMTHRLENSYEVTHQLYHFLHCRPHLYLRYSSNCWCFLLILQKLFYKIDNRIEVMILWNGVLSNSFVFVSRYYQFVKETSKGATNVLNVLSRVTIYYEYFLRCFCPRSPGRFRSSKPTGSLRVTSVLLIRF